MLFRNVCFHEFMTLLKTDKKGPNGPYITIFVIERYIFFHVGSMRQKKTEKNVCL